MRWLIRLAGVLLLIAVVAIGSVLLLPGDRIARIVADQIKAQTGRELALSGETQVTLWPVLGIATGPVSFANASWSDQDAMFVADSLAIAVNTAGLFGGDVRITKIEAENPVIRLEQRADGRANWLFRPAAPAPSDTAASGNAQAGPDAEGGQFTLEHLDIKNARLIYAVEGQETLDIGGVDLSLLWPDAAGPAQFNAIARPNRQDLSVDATIEQFSKWTQGQPQPIALAVSGPGGAVSFTGVAGILGELAGQATIKTPDTGTFLDALGLGPIDLPQGLGQSVDMQAKVTLTRENILSLRDGVLDLDGNKVRAEADITLGEVPQITARVTAGKLDLTALTADGGGDIGAAHGADPVAQSSGWSKAPIDASGLSAFDGTIALKADAIDFGKLRLDRSSIGLNLSRSRAVLKLTEVQAYGGQITGEVVLNNRSGFSTGGSLQARDIALNGLLSDVAGWTRLTGQADVQLSFLAAGQSVDAIMHSLSGEGAVSVGRGTISGLDLDRLIRSGDGGGGTTVFDSLSASLLMLDGTAQNDDLLLVLPQIETRGAGRIGLAAKDINYTITPVALKARSGSGLAIPIRISGPWSAPRIVPDVAAALDLNLAKEREALEDKVQSEVERTLQKELGVTPQEGQSTEDAIRDAVEEELGRSLKKLFE